MKTNINLIAVLLFATTLSACKKDDVDSGPGSISSIPSVADAKLLVILNDDVLGNSDNAQLVKISTTDQVSTVSFNGSNGGSASTFRPYTLSNAHPDFILLTVNSYGTGIANQGYLMKKSDGSLISVDDNGVPTTTDVPSLNYPFTYYDGSSYIYTLAGDKSMVANLIRISTTNPNYITTTKLTGDTIRSILGFEVDADNNILANADVTSGKRYLLAFNATNTTKIVTGGSRSYWKNQDGIFSYKSHSDNSIKTVTSSGAGQPFTVTNDINLTTYGLNPQLYRDQSYRVTYGGKFIMVSDSKIYELDNASHTPKEITTVPFSNQKWVDHSQTNGIIFIAAENASAQQTIFRIDVANNYAYTTYPTPGKYNFYEIEAFEDGTVYATAKRNSDGKNVILKFAADGTETLLDETLNKRGVWLEKVTEFTNN